MTSYLSWLGQGPSFFGRSGRGVGFRKEFEEDEEDEASEALKPDCATGRGNDPGCCQGDSCTPERPQENGTPPFVSQGEALPDAQRSQPVPLPKAFWHCALPCGDEALPEPSENPPATGTTPFSKGNNHSPTAPEMKVVEPALTASVPEATDMNGGAADDYLDTDPAAGKLVVQNLKAAHEVPLIALTLEHEPLPLDVILAHAAEDRWQVDVAENRSNSEEIVDRMEATPRPLADPAVEGTPGTVTRSCPGVRDSSEFSPTVDSPMVCVEALPDQDAPPTNLWIEPVLEIKGDQPVDPPLDSPIRAVAPPLIELMSDRVSGDAAASPVAAAYACTDSGPQPLIELMSARGCCGPAVASEGAPMNIEAQPLIELLTARDSGDLLGDPATETKDRNLTELLHNRACVSGDLLVDSPYSTIETAQRHDHCPDAQAVPVPNLTSCSQEGSAGTHQQHRGVSVGTQTEHGALDEALAQVVLLQARLEASEAALREAQKNQQCRPESPMLPAHLGNG